MDKGLIPRRYAKALYEVGEQRNVNDSLYDTMQKLAAAFAANNSLAPTMANPFVPVADKVSLLETAAGFGKNGADATFADFTKLLADNRRLDIARDIALAFIDLYRTRHNIYKVAVASAAPLGDAEKKRLQDIIAAHIGKGTMEYDYTVDPSLIGGFTVTVNSERLDASVANRLKQIRLQLVD
ncbi:MAG: ATP synthase F1 subunit delta [Muribaculaceae bacterium]|nr:ATP synthase F1 subunit delta [Muribaculaceae bacterium]